MTKKSTTPLQKNGQKSSKKVIIAISIIVILSIALASVLYFVFSQRSEAAFSLNAVIIDQLGAEFPNPAFLENVTSILKSSGFNVSYYNESLDVNFFKGLAKHNYGIIILRAHSALREDNSTVDLFTSEEFTEDKALIYQRQLEGGFLTKGEYLYRPGRYYFAITSRFVENLEGRFPKSIVFAMGCWSLKPDLKPEPDKLAKAFIGKGAKAYVGWTDLVWPNQTDNETLKLLGKMLVENKTLENAVSETLSYPYLADHQTVTTRLRFYPSDAGDLRVSDLINEAKAP